MKKIAFIAAAVAALSLAACNETPTTETVEVPENEAAAVELNADGSVKTESDNAEAADEATSGSAVAPVGQQHQL